MEFLGIKSTGWLPVGLKKCTAREIPRLATTELRLLNPRGSSPTWPIACTRKKFEAVEHPAELLPAASDAQTASEQRDRVLSQEKTEAAQLSDQVTHSAARPGDACFSQPAGCGHCSGPSVHCITLYLFFLSK